MTSLDVRAVGRDPDVERVAGWWPRPPGVLLQPSRLELRRRRRMAALAVERPALHALLERVQQRSRACWDAVLPRKRVLTVTGLVVLLTVFDAFATFVVVGVGIAEEANPLLAGLIDRIGLLPAMGVRVAVGVGLTLVLAWLSTWRRAVRPMLAFVALVLALVAVVHIVGTATALA